VSALTDMSDNKIGDHSTQVISNASSASVASTSPQ
jgi:hypothetical protein